MDIIEDINISLYHWHWSWSFFSTTTIEEVTSATKHIDIRITQHVWQLIYTWFLEIVLDTSEDKSADIYTRGVGQELFTKHTNKNIVYFNENEEYRVNL